MDVRPPADKKIGFRYSETESSLDAMRRLFLGSGSLRCNFGSSLALLASASLALGAALLGFLALFALLAACLLLGSGSVLLVAVTAATYHCNGSDQNNE